MAAQEHVRGSIVGQKSTIILSDMYKTNEQQMSKGKPSQVQM
jgi:hypothetical protein